MEPPPLRIGSLTINPPVLLAPMAGYTDSAFRSLCLEHHCGLAFTELATAEGVYRGHKRTLNYLETFPDERPIGAHVYGSKPDTMAGAAAAAQQTGRFALVDLNAGCPIPKIMSRGAGAGLLRDPVKLVEMVRRVRREVTIPLTVKTRLGLVPSNCVIVDLARGLEDAGADAIFLHARFVSERHAGTPHLDILRQVKGAVKIPVIGNGGIRSGRDAVEMIRQTGVDGVMIGQWAIGNPWAFEEVACALTGRAFHAPDATMRRAVMVEHLDLLAEVVARERPVRRRHKLTPEQSASVRFRCHLVKYLAGYAGLRSLLKRLESLKTFDGLLAEIDRVLAA